VFELLFFAAFAAAVAAGAVALMRSIGAFFTIRCDICDLVLTSRHKHYTPTVDGRKMFVCSKCNTQIQRRQRGTARDEFLGDARSAEQEHGTYQRRSIPSAVKREVWRRDQGCCVQCGSRRNLEYDHIIPVSKGGANTARNIELLCETCNRQKSDKI